MSKKKKSKKLKKAAKSRLAKSEKKLLSASDALLTISVETGKKWHKLFKHSITTSEPILEKQIDMFFDTTEAVSDQLEEGADRFKKLLGIKEDIGDIVQKKISKNKIAKQLASSANKLIAIVDDSGIRDTLEKGAVKIKMEITERLGGKGKKKAKKKSAKKKAGKKKSTAKKSKLVTTKKASKSVKTKTTVAKRRGRPVGSKKKTAAAKKAISSSTKTSTQKATAKRRGRPAGTTNKSTTAKKATTGAKRGPKPGTKRKTTATSKKTTRSVKVKKTATPKKTIRSVKVKKTAPAKKATTGAKRGPKPGAKRKVTATAKKATTASKRGRKPKAGKPGYDDLKKVMGIGAKMEKILNEKGIKTYNQLKSMKVGDLQGIINGAGGYYQSYKPQMWKSEAALAAAGKFDQMKSGRR